MYDVSTEKEKKLIERMRHLGIKEGDLKESFVRSSGPGGQNVNKVATCVYLCHERTGITIKCQKERSQAANRFHARCLLCETMERKRMAAIHSQKQAWIKARRQNRKRSRSEKEKILESKRKNSEKKKFRKNIHFSKLGEL